MSYPPADTTAIKKSRRPRRVADHILTAFHQACDQRDLEVAEQLLAVLAGVITGGRHQPTAPDRHDQESLSRGLRTALGPAASLRLGR